MRKGSLILILIFVFIGGSTHAAFIDNTEQCLADMEDVKEPISISGFTHIDAKLAEAAAIVNAIDDQPLGFLVQITAKSAIILSQTGNRTIHAGAGAVEKLVSYAAETPACVKNAELLTEGVDCFIRLPNKVLTLSFATGARMTGEVVVGIHTLSTNVLHATRDLWESFSDPILDRLLETDTAAGELAAVPFMVIGTSLQTAEVLIDVILADTIAGGIGQMISVGYEFGANVCDLLKSVVRLQLDKALLYALKGSLDLTEEGLLFLANILTFGQLRKGHGTPYPYDKLKELMD